LSSRLVQISTKWLYLLGPLSGNVICMTPIGPVDATRVPRYAGPATFARLPRTDEVTHTDVAVVGIPFDSGVSYRPGARFGPGHIRAASKLLRPYHPRLDVEPFAAQQVAEAGDIAVNPFDIAEAITTIERASDELRDGGTKLISLGGDHTIALPLLRSLHRDHGPIAVLHFDAHLDTWDTYFGAPFTHGTPFRRASEEGLLDPEHCLHVGIRGRCMRPPICPTTACSASKSSAPTTSSWTGCPR
jgi:agmatinase